MILIGLVGKKQSGKDTFYEVVKTVSPCRRIGFADAMKYEVAKAIFSVDIGTARWTSIKQVLAFLESNKAEARLLYQAWGTNFRRNLIDHDYWVTKVMNNLISGHGAATIIVPDCRFQNEAAMIKNVGGFLIKVVRKSDAIDNHVSETELDSIACDYVIHNNDTLEFYQKNCLMVYNQIVKIVCISQQTVKH